MQQEWQKLDDCLVSARAWLSTICLEASVDLRLLLSIGLLGERLVSLKFWAFPGLMTRLKNPVGLPKGIAVGSWPSGSNPQITQEPNVPRHYLTIRMLEDAWCPSDIKVASNADAQAWYFASLIKNPREAGQHKQCTTEDCRFTQAKQIQTTNPKHTTSHCRCD